MYVMTVIFEGLETNIYCNVIDHDIFEMLCFASNAGMFREFRKVDHVPSMSEGNISRAMRFIHMVENNI